MGYEDELEEKRLEGEALIAQLERSLQRREDETQVVFESPIARSDIVGPSFWAWQAADAACEELGLDVSAIELRWFSYEHERGYNQRRIKREAKAGGFCIPEVWPNVAWIHRDIGTRLAHVVVHELAHLSGIEDENECEEWGSRVVRKWNL